MGFTQGSGEKRALLALLQAHQGELDAALAAVSEATAICNSLGDRFTLAICLATRTFIALRREEPAAAVEHAEHIRQILPSGYDTPVWLDFEGDELEALIALGETAEAERRLDSLERRSREEPRLRLTIWAARGRSLLLASEGKLAEALATLDTLLADNDLTPAPFEHAETLLRKGQLERRSKHKTDARATLEQSAALFQLLGAGGEAQHARAELARLGLRQAKQELTETERRVAELVAAGMTNREIAAALFINRRTVEANVARIYRKLGVRTRAALANQMANPDRQPATTAPGPASLSAADAPELPERLSPRLTAAGHRPSSRPQRAQGLILGRAERKGPAAVALSPVGSPSVLGNALHDSSRGERRFGSHDRARRAPCAIVHVVNGSGTE